MVGECDIPGALIEALRDARHVCILTGAGVSAESGVPTFRDAQDGLWAEYEPQDLATPDAFVANPALIWRWYRWRRELVAKAEPNAGHYAIAELENRIAEVTLVTQNVDSLHQRAGSNDVIEFHGNLFTEHCFSCGKSAVADDASEVPVCPDCGGNLRPGVVWFGESIPETSLNESSAAAMECDVFLSVGTSSLVYPAAGLSALAADSGATVAEINPKPTAHADGFHFAVAGKSGVVFPKLIESLAL